MATSQAGSVTAAAVGGATNVIRETIVGSHVLKIDGFLATKDLGVGKSIKSSTFSVGGHVWYIECYPCGDVEESAGLVTLQLCLHLPGLKDKVQAKCWFTLMDHDGIHEAAAGQDINNDKRTYDADSLWRYNIDIVEREDLEKSILKHKEDWLQIRCDVYIFKEFPAVLPPSLIASGVHSTYDDTNTAAGISAGNVDGSHVLTIDNYSKAKKALPPGEKLESELFDVRGHSWYLILYPNGKKNESDCLTIDLVSNDITAVKVRFQLTQLNCSTEPEISALQDRLIHVKCDITFLKEITPMRPPDLHRHFGNLLASQVGTDVTFEVGGDLFPAHKCVLATRSTAFMAEFFGSRDGSDITTTVTRVLIDDIEPRVFKALLHFIYTDTLPEVREDDDKILVAQGLIVAADRYAMERLKLICADMLCNYVNDARTAVTSLELAVKHGCRRLSEKCLDILKGQFA